MQTYENVLHIYSMHTSKETVMSTGSSLSSAGETAEFHRVDIYMQQSQRLSSGTATANDFVGDSRALLIGFSNGSLQMYSWQAKVSC